jgi:crotonobetainyl-CoA:carnitine CoA-transferase CaiB-like acyl-CoA transferase
MCLSISRRDDDKMNPPLHGIRVLDLSQSLAGPACTMILADLGADVIKVEIPNKGDMTRSWGPPFIKGESAYFLSVNRNKKSITLNLKKEKGREILYKLSEKFDVFIENFRSGVTDKLEIDYETIQKINPNIIYCSISGFGQTGPYRDRPAYDLMIQGMSGFMGITGEPNRPPVRIGVAITDLISAMYSSIAILSALIAREKVGMGQYIDIALLDGAVSWMTYMASNYFATGEIPKRSGNSHPSIVPYQGFKTKDEKYIILAVGNDRLWKSFCDVLGFKELAENPKFSTNPKRVENREELVSVIAKQFLTKTRKEWLKILAEKVPCGPIYTMDEIFRDPQVLHRGMLVELDHSVAGKIKQIGIPINLAKTPAKIKSPPPTLGEHSEEILKDILNFSEDEINKLKIEEVV